MEEPRKPYQLLDTYDMRVLGEYFTQDRAMQDLYNFMRSWGLATARTLNIMYVADDDSETLLCHGGMLEIKDWYKSLEELTFRLRLEGGTDVLGIGEYIQHSEGLLPIFTESSTPANELDFWRYRCTINTHVGGGATKLEALSRAYLEYKKHGKSTTL